MKVGKNLSKIKTSKKGEVQFEHVYFKYPDADDVWLKVAEHFGKNFFLEVQTHNTESQKQLNAHIIQLAQEHELQIICGLDSHYINPFL